MGHYEKAFESHAVHDAAQQLLSTLNEKLESDIESTSIDQRNHLLQAAKYIQSRLSVASPVLTTTPQLDPIGQSVRNALNQYNQFVSTKSAGHLKNAINEINGAITRAASLPTLEASIPGFNADDALQFGQLAQEHIKRVDAHSEQVKEKLSDLMSLTDSMTAQAEELRRQFIAVTEKQKQFEETFDQKAEAAFAQFNKSAEEQREAFKVLFESEASARSNHFKSEIDQIVQAHDDELEKLKQANSEHFDFLDAQKKRVENVVGLIENDGLTGNFQRTARQERNAANWLRAGAILSYVVMVGIIIWTAFDVSSLLNPSNGHEGQAKEGITAGIDYFLLFARLFTAFILLVPAKYFAAEASKHMAIAERNRRFELELATIDAYYLHLPEEERAREKAKFGEKYFGQIDSVEAESSGPLQSRTGSPATAEEIRAMSGAI